MTVSAVSVLLREKLLPPMRCAAALIAALSATRIDCIDMRVPPNENSPDERRKHQTHAHNRACTLDVQNARYFSFGYGVSSR